MKTVRVESTTPRKLILASAPYKPGRGTDGFETKLKLHELREWDVPATPAIRIPYKTRKARRAARHGDSGQHPKPLVVRKREPAHPLSFTLVGKGLTRRIWRGGISQRGY